MDFPVWGNTVPPYGPRKRVREQSFSSNEQYPGRQENTHKTVSPEKLWRSRKKQSNDQRHAVEGDQ